MNSQPLAYAVAVPPPNSFIKNYVFCVKKCLWYEPLYTLHNDNNMWILHKSKNSEFKFSVHNFEHLYNICTKLGMLNTKYKIILQDVNNEMVSYVKCDDLISSIDWCYSTESELSHVISIVK